MSLPLSYVPLFLVCELAFSFCAKARYLLACFSFYESASFLCASFSGLLAWLSLLCAKARYYEPSPFCEPVFAFHNESHS
jgi:hypothetical protein